MKNLLSAFLIILFTSMSSFSQVNWNLDLLTSNECSGSENGSINITFSRGGTVPPNEMPYPLPYEVSFTHEDGTSGTIIMTHNSFPINFLKYGKYKVVIYFDHACYVERLAEIFEEINTLDFDYLIHPVNCSSTNDGSLELEYITGGNPPYSFNWSNGSNQGSINMLSKGTYCVTIYDVNGCRKSGCFDVDVDQSYKCNFEFLYSIKNYISNSDKGAITLENVDNPNLKYFWTGNNGYISSKKSPSSLLPGSYCVDIFCCSNRIINKKCFEIIKNCDLVASPNGLVNLDLFCASVTLELNIHYFKTEDYRILVKKEEEPGRSTSKTIDFFSPGTYLIEVTNLSTYCQELITVNIIDKREPIKGKLTLTILEKGTCGKDYNKSGIYEIANNYTKVINYFIKDVLGNLQYNGSVNPNEKRLFFNKVGLYSIVYYTDNIDCSESLSFFIGDSKGNNLSASSIDASCNFTDGSLIVDLLREDAKITISGNGFNKSDVLSLSKGKHYFNAAVGKYKISNTLCPEIENLNVNQIYSSQDINVDIRVADNRETYGGEGEAVIYIKNLCTEKLTDYYYLLTSNSSSIECNNVFLKGEKRNSTFPLTLRSLTEGIYYLYIYCGECCAREQIIIPATTEENDLKIEANCSVNGGKTKLTITGHEFCNFSWSGNGSNERSIEINSSGEYCVNIYCGTKYKYLCRYVDILPKVNVQQECLVGSINYNHVILHENSDGPFTYIWPDGTTSNEKYLQVNNSNPIYVTVTDNNGCSQKIQIKQTCCPYKTGSYCTKLPLIFHPSSGENNGKIIMTGETTCSYTWAGPNGFKNEGRFLENLAPGDYTCYSSDCKSITLKLRDCINSNYNVDVSGNTYCWNRDEMIITFKVHGSDMIPPFSMDCYTSNGLDSEEKNKGIFKFKFTAYRINNPFQLPYVVLTDGAGCVSRHYFNVFPRLSSKIVSTPPACKQEFYCDGKFQFSQPAELTEDFKKIECTLSYTCGNTTENLQGDIHKVTIHDKESNECIEGSVCVFQSPNGDKKIYRSRGDWVRVNCPQVNLTFEERIDDPIIFKTNFSDIYNAIISFWPTYKNKMCGTYQRKYIYNGGFDTHFEIEAYISDLKYCYDDKEGKCKETHECWGYPENSQTLTYHHDLYKEKVVPYAKCENPNAPNCLEPPGLKDCPTKFHYLNNLNAFVSFGFNGKAIKMSFYDQNGIFVNSRHTQVNIPDAHDWEFNIIDLIQQGTGFSLLANATKLEGIGSSILLNNDDPNVIKIDFDGNGIFVNSSLLFNDSYTKLFDVLMNPNGSADLLISNYPYDNGTGNLGVSLKIVNLNNNLTGSPLDLPMNSIPSDAKIVKSNSGLTVISTNNTSTIPAIDIISFNSSNSTWTTSSIPVNGTINSIYSAQLGYHKAIVNYSSLDDSINYASIFDIQNPAIGFINTITSSQSLEVKSIVPDELNADYYLSGTFKGDMNISVNNSMSSELKDIFMIRYNVQNNLISYLQSTGQGSDNLIDGVVSTDNKFGLLTTFNGPNIQFNGNSVNGIDYDCNATVFIIDPRTSGNQIKYPDISSRITRNLAIEGMYPNPTQDNVNFIFTSTDLQIIDYIIHDPTGKVMKTYKDVNVQKGRSVKECNLKDLSQGMYFITVKSSEEVIGVYKIIKK
ncbi:MAG: T9SS type A sorting domain-containing protein [Saprospiraceae bacterium]|nr:T9SS type A sorting domain-containing protein [Saprospiraceae bacterium]